MGDSNYIGSKIFLISKSDIRYVGILQNVDTQTSSLVLGQVQSFGTEGRRGGLQDEIPPSSIIFEYIVFHGADVKDLQVVEAPPVPMTMYGLTRYPHPPLTYFYNNYSIPAISPYGPPVIYTTILPYPSPDTILAPPRNATRSMITQKPQVPDDVPDDVPFNTEVLAPSSSVELSATGDGNKHLIISKPDAKDSPITPSRTHLDPLDIASNTTDMDGLTRLVDDLDVGNMKERSPTEEKKILDMKKTTSGRRKSSSERTSNSKSIKNSATKESALQDFDFASSNAKFNKKVNPMTVDSVDTFYDKSKSFFDNISCEAKERTEPIVINRNFRKKQEDEKQLNLETFGQTYIHQGRKQGRRGGRMNSKRRNNRNQQRGSSENDHLDNGP